MFTSSIKREMRHFHVVVVQKLERNVQKVWCTCEVVVLLIKPIFSLTFSFLSASLDLKVPINDQVSVSWLAQLFSALHQYRRGRGLNPGKPESFQAFFSHKLRLYLRGSSLHFFSSCVDLSHGSFVLFLHKHSSSRVQIFLLTEILITDLLVEESLIFMYCPLGSRSFIWLLVFRNSYVWTFDWKVSVVFFPACIFQNLSVL